MHQRTTRTSIKGPGLYYSLLSTKGGGKICDLPAVLVVFLCPCTLKKIFGLRTAYTQDGVLKSLIYARMCV